MQEIESVDREKDKFEIVGYVSKVLNALHVNDIKDKSKFLGERKDTKQSSAYVHSGTHVLVTSSKMGHCLVEGLGSRTLSS